MSWIRILIINFLLAFIFLEIGLYFLEERQYKKEKDNGYSNVFRSVPNKSYLYDHYPNLEYSLSSNGSQYKIITNEMGHREIKDYSFLDTSIIFLGDSIIEGASVENYETLDHFFESKTGIISLNFGMSSFNTIQEYEYLKDKYQDNYNSKLVILGFCLNDLLQNHYIRSFDSESSNWRVHKYLYADKENGEATHQSLLIDIKGILKNSRILRTAYNFYMLSFYQDEYFIPSAEELRFTEKAIEALQSYVNSIGADLFVVIYPYRHQLESKNLSKLSPQDQLLPILEKLRINSLNLLHPLRELYSEDPDTNIYHDNVHPNAKGHEIIAQILIDDLNQKSLLPIQLEQN